MKSSPKPATKKYHAKSTDSKPVGFKVSQKTCAGITLVEYRFYRKGLKRWWRIVSNFTIQGFKTPKEAKDFYRKHVAKELSYQHWREKKLAEKEAQNA